MEDKMKKYEPKHAETMRGLGIGFLIAGILSAFLDLEQYQTTSSIMGAGLLTGGYLCEGVAYLRGYFNEKLDLLSKTKSDLEKKLN